ncbi:MAG: hypothetical protein WC781_04340 [Candidatus Pacearchaeota archaeon]|jgi:hypothetical protein
MNEEEIIRTHEKDKKELSVLAKKSYISKEKIEEILKSAKSPAVGNAQDFITLGEQYGIDPTIALAFFMKESTLGSNPRADITINTKSIGNIRYLPDCPTGENYRGFCKYISWKQGIEYWYKLISGEKYIGNGLDTVEKIVEKYAPADDGNDIDEYVHKVRGWVKEWRDIPNK